MLPGSWVSPSARFRVLQYVELLEKQGHEIIIRVIRPERDWSSPLSGFLCTLHSRLASLFRIFSALWITRDSAKFDIVFMQRDLIPETSITFLEPMLRRRRDNLVFDFDDAIFLGARDEKLRRILPLCALVIAGNEYLASYARTYNENVVVIPTVIDTQRFHALEKDENSTSCVGWTGSKSTVLFDLPCIWPVLDKLSREMEFEFLVIADEAPLGVPESVCMKFIPWSPENEITALRKMDVGIMPLRDEPRTRGKCGAKLLTYGAVGIPAVASAVGVNEKITLHGVTGYLCQTETEWHDSLRKLLRDKLLREEMGRKARVHIQANYSLSIWSLRLVKYLKQVASSS